MFEMPVETLINDRSISPSSASALHASTLLDQRWQQHGVGLEQNLVRLYGERQASALLLALREIMQLSLTQRSAALHALDQARLAQPDWFCQQDMLAYCAYVDRFAGTLSGVQERIPHLQNLGVRYLHLLPFLKARAGENDGGFAVASFEEVQPELGSIDDLQALCTKLREAGISLCSDLVLNHVADDHAWAMAAKAGDSFYQDFFHHFDDRRMPDLYEQDLGQIFPQAAPGNFSYVQALEKWVWTTFYPFQWDLNYANPQVFLHMVKALLQLANWGVEVFRLDSTAFLWKRLGTNCMNQVEAHWILQALRDIVSIAAPAVLLKAEAIVPTAELPPYLGHADGAVQECHIAYHSSLMAAGWVALAEQNVDALRAVLRNTPVLPPQTTWLTYVRCHDDIGWNVLRAELAQKKVEELSEGLSEGAGSADGSLERLQLVSNFYAGGANSYADGLRFQASDPNAVHGTVGMTAALCGVRGDDVAANAVAVRRMLMLYSLAMSFGGMPLLYMGDELGQGNDVSYQNDTQRQHDARWLQRPYFDQTAFEAVQAGRDCSVAAALYHGLCRMSAQRRQLPALAAHATRELLELASPTLFAFERRASVALDAPHTAVCVFNFSETEQSFNLQSLVANQHSLRYWHGLDGEGALNQATRQCFKIAPYDAIWFYA